MEIANSYSIPVSKSAIPNYKETNKYFITIIEGNCLDSEKSPIRIKDFDFLLCHFISVSEFILNWHEYQGKIILVVPIVPNSLNITFSLVKQLVDVVQGRFVVMRMFNPAKDIVIPVDEIKIMAIVDKVLSDGHQ